MAEHSRGHGREDRGSPPAGAQAAGDIASLGRIAARAVRLAPSNDNRRPSSHLIQAFLIALAAFGGILLAALVLV